MREQQEIEEPYYPDSIQIPSIRSRFSSISGIQPNQGLQSRYQSIKIRKIDQNQPSQVQDPRLERERRFSTQIQPNYHEQSDLYSTQNSTTQFQNYQNIILKKIQQLLLESHKFQGQNLPKSILSSLSSKDSSNTAASNPEMIRQC